MIATKGYFYNYHHNPLLYAGKKKPAPSPKFNEKLANKGGINMMDG